MLRVKKDRAPAIFQIRDRVAYHGEVVLQTDIQGPGHVEVPGLGHDGDNIRFRGNQGPEKRVLAAGDALFLRGAEGGYGRVGELLLPDFPEELVVLRVRAGPAPFNVVDPETIERPGDEELVVKGKGYPHGLRAVSEGRIVQCYRFSGHKPVPLPVSIIMDKSA